MAKIRQHAFKANQISGKKIAVPLFDMIKPPLRDADREIHDDKVYVESCFSNVYSVSALIKTVSPGYAQSFLDISYSFL